MKLRQNLYRQILIIVLIMFTVIYLSMAIILPKLLIPFYERSIYLYLQTPLDINEAEALQINGSVGYISVDGHLTVASENLKEVIDMPTTQILKKINNNRGKFEYRGKTYYYITKQNDNKYEVAITNDNYGIQIRNELIGIILPLLLFALSLMLVIITWWSQSLARKIKQLKDKVDNLDNDNYVGKYDYKIDDELKVLNDAIDDMKIALQSQEEYKNQMYQNISHDFKTPLTVIKSYIEAIEDGIQDEKSGLKIIKQEIKKLEIKVHSLLYLNKLTYFKDMENYKSGKVDIRPLLKKSISKFKITRPDIKWQLIIKDETIYRGTKDMWENVIDNIFSNFTRYAKTKITVTIQDHKIIFYNDGPKIDENILNDLFSPYKKGINGQFGLGLSIVKRTISLLDYEVSAKNEKNGITFQIE